MWRLRALVLQHQDDAPPALLSDWAQQRGVRLDVMRPDLHGDLDEPDGVDFVAVLGSDAHAYERSEPWVAPELEWLRGLNDRGLPILGICYGAQALAVALGGAVRALPEPEIGWISVPTVEPDLIEPGPWFTWHEDRIELPAGARDRRQRCLSAGIRIRAPSWHPVPPGGDHARADGMGGRSRRCRAARARGDRCGGVRA